MEIVIQKAVTTPRATWSVSRVGDHVQIVIEGSTDEDRGVFARAAMQHGEALLLASSLLHAVGVGMAKKNDGA